VRERLASSTDFCMNLWILNECMTWKWWRSWLNWFSHLAKQPYHDHEWLNPCTLYELEYEWMSLWTLNLNVIAISTYATLGYRRALYGLRQICPKFGVVCLGDFCCRNEGNSHTKSQVIKKWIKKREYKK